MFSCASRQWLRCPSRDFPFSNDWMLHKLFMFMSKLFDECFYFLNINAFSLLMGSRVVIGLISIIVISVCQHNTLTALQVNVILFYFLVFVLFDDEPNWEEPLYTFVTKASSCVCLSMLQHIYVYIIEYCESCPLWMCWVYLPNRSHTLPLIPPWTLGILMHFKWNDAVLRLSSHVCVHANSIPDASYFCQWWV